MPISEALVIALFGPSGCGKTTLAEILSRTLGCPLRCGGEEVRKLANEHRVRVTDVSHDGHGRVDDETRRWASSQTGLAVVEGRFINFVLSDVSVPIVFVHVWADQLERARRLSARQGIALEAVTVTKVDSADERFIREYYGGIKPAVGLIKVDTSRVGPEVGVEVILRCVSGFDDHVHQT